MFLSLQLFTNQQESARPRLAYFDLKNIDKVEELSMTKGSRLFPKHKQV